MDKRVEAKWKELVSLCRSNLDTDVRQSETVFRGQMRAIVEADVEVTRLNDELLVQTEKAIALEVKFEQLRTLFGYGRKARSKKAPHTCTAGLPESDRFPCRACEDATTTKGTVSETSEPSGPVGLDEPEGEVDPAEANPAAIRN